MHLVRGQLTTIVERVKGFCKRVVTVGTFEALMSFGGASMFMSFAVSAEGAFHKAVNGIERVENILSHTSSDHNH